MSGGQAELPCVFPPWKATFPALRGIESPRVSGKSFDLMPQLRALLSFQHHRESCLLSAKPSDRRQNPGNTTNNR